MHAAGPGMRRPPHNVTSTPNERTPTMIVLDYRDKRPLYEQVAEKLSRLIICGALEPDSRLPSVRSLAVDLSVNPNTIQRAYAQLEQEGYLYTVVGRGNFVAHSGEWRSGKLRELERDFTALLTQARDAGLPAERVRELTDQVYHAANAASSNEETPGGNL